MLFKVYPDDLLVGSLLDFSSLLPIDLAAAFLDFDFDAVFLAGLEGSVGNKRILCAKKYMNIGREEQIMRVLVVEFAGYLSQL